ncbi:MAG: hypothetical protein ACFFDI_08395 [Promethearchaeota archaeon]
MNLNEFRWIEVKSLEDVIVLAIAGATLPMGGSGVIYIVEKKDEGILAYSTVTQLVTGEEGGSTFLYYTKLDQLPNGRYVSFEKDVNEYKIVQNVVDDPRLKFIPFVFLAGVVE